MSQTQQCLGAHFSISKGFEQAIKDAESIGCTTAQIFLHSNRQWHIKPIDPHEATHFKTFLHTTTINPLITHAGYLINLASDDSSIVAKSLHTLKYELKASAQLGIPYVVLHPGSNTNATQGIKNIIRNINTVLDHTNNTVLLLENTAGQGSSLCWSLEDMGHIIKEIEQQKHIGVCLDTCHAFAAGYDFTTQETYKTFWGDFDSAIGFDYLHAIHLNDSKKGLGSHIDRHENIGKGLIGLTAFGLLMNDTHLTKIPKILETPYESSQTACTTYQKDMQILLGLVKKQHTL